MPDKSSLTDDVKARAQSEAEDLRDTAADEIENISDAADAAADELPDDSPQARITEQVASQIDSVVDQLRRTDLSHMTRDVSTFARQNPLLFVGGAALLGLAVTRFLKASGSATAPSGPTDPWATRTTSNPAQSEAFDVPS